MMVKKVIRLIFRVVFVSPRPLKKLVKVRYPRPTRKYRKL